jgi:hypothetical protein
MSDLPESSTVGETNLSVNPDTEAPESPEGIASAPSGSDRDDRRGHDYSQNVPKGARKIGSFIIEEVDRVIGPFACTAHTDLSIYEAKVLAIIGSKIS